MTTIDQYPLAPEHNVDPTSTLAFDTFRDIHKGVRAELFAVTASAGNTDPSSRQGRAALSPISSASSIYSGTTPPMRTPTSSPCSRLMLPACSTATRPSTPTSTPGWPASPSGPLL